MATARLTDPETSHKAARSITTEAITKTQAAILEILKLQNLTDEGIREWYDEGVKLGYWKPTSESGLRSRRAELVERGLVIRAGRGTTRFGRECNIWKLA